MRSTRPEMFARALELYIVRLESLPVDKDVKLNSPAIKAGLELEAANAKKALEQIREERARGPNLRHTLCRALKFYRNLLEEEEARVAKSLGENVDLPIYFKNEEIKLIDSATEDICSEHVLNQSTDPTAQGYKADEEPY